MCYLDFFLFYCLIVGFDCFFFMLDIVGSDILSYLFYNIEWIGDNVYWIIMVVVGFIEDELMVEVKEYVFIIKGEKLEEENDCEVLYCGIVLCIFECWFQIVEYVCVDGVSLENGLFYVDFVCELLEVMKFCKIEILIGGVKQIEIIVY